MFTMQRRPCVEGSYATRVSVCAIDSPFCYQMSCFKETISLLGDGRDPFIWKILRKGGP